MVRKVSFLVISVAILVFGVSAFFKLGYWERSARIFALNPRATISGRAGDNHDRTRGFYGREEREHSGAGRERFGSDNDLPNARQLNKDIPDSLNQKAVTGEREQAGKGSFRGGMREGEGRREGDLRGGKKINLGKVFLFLAVFASFTVIAIYTDKGVGLIRKRKAG
jgi:hypothetical protein